MTLTVLPPHTDGRPRHREVKKLAQGLTARRADRLLPHLLPLVIEVGVSAPGGS